MLVAAAEAAAAGAAGAATVTSGMEGLALAGGQQVGVGWGCAVAFSFIRLFSTSQLRRACNVLFVRCMLCTVTRLLERLSTPDFLHSLHRLRHTCINHCYQYYDILPAFLSPCTSSHPTVPPNSPPTSCWMRSSHGKALVAVAQQQRAHASTQAPTALPPLRLGPLWWTQQRTRLSTQVLLIV